MTTREEARAKILRANDTTLHAGGGTPGNNGNGEVVSVLSLCRIEPYEPFPVDALPPRVKELVAEGAAALGCDAAYVALPALAAVAAAIGNSRVVRLKNSWVERAILWTAAVGESGTLKTPGYKLVEEVLKILRRLLRKEHQAEMAQYQSDAAAWEVAAAEAKAKNEEPPSKPRKPVERRFYTSDVTIERLAALLEDNPRGLLMARDELAAWIMSFTKYKGKAGGSDMHNWLELYQAGTIEYDRKTGDRTRVSVDLASVSVTGGVQPRVLAKLMRGEHYDSGFAARLMMAMPPRRRKEWREDDLGEATKDGFSQLVRALTELNMVPLEKDPEVQVPERLLLTKAAKRAWVEWYNEWAQVQYESDGDEAAANSKVEAVAARLALIHHVVTEVAEGRDATAPVGLASMDCGVRLARWFARESRRIYATLKQSDEQRELTKLAEWLESQPQRRATPRDLQNRSGGKYPTSDAAREALDGLVRLRLARWDVQPPGPKGGRPTESCVLLDDGTDTTTEPTQPTKPTQPPAGRERGELRTRPPVRCLPGCSVTTCACRSKATDSSTTPRAAC